MYDYDGDPYSYRFKNKDEVIEFLLESLGDIDYEVLR
jgi:hypothetical protein